MLFPLRPQPQAIIGKRIRHDCDVAADYSGELCPGEQESAPRTERAVEIFVIAPITRVFCRELGIANRAAPGQHAAHQPQCERHQRPAGIRKNARRRAKDRRADEQRTELPRRGLPVRTRDPLGNDTTLAYDRPYHLLPEQVTDPVGLKIQAEHDYRVLQPKMVTDRNGNRSAVSFSPLGFVTATAVMGKQGEPVGDTIENPGSRLEYDFFAFANRLEPVFVRSIVREHHITETDVPLPERDATIETVEYSDGFGRLLQTRTQAEDVLFGDPTFGGGVLPADQSAPRAMQLAGSGRWTICRM